MSAKTRKPSLEVALTALAQTPKIHAAVTYLQFQIHVCILVEPAVERRGPFLPQTFGYTELFRVYVFVWFVL